MIINENSQAVKILEVADDPRLSREVKAFLALHSNSRCSVSASCE